MTRQEQQAIRREVQAWCPARYSGGFRMFFDAQCKLPIGHSLVEHKTWRQGVNKEDGALILIWTPPLWANTEEG